MLFFNQLSQYNRLLPYELFIGLRYTRAKRKNHFISFISLTSMVGIALGVAAIIIVLSVMNGFEKELRNSILGVASHIEITGNTNQLSNWQTVENQIKKNPEVIGAAPYINAQGMLSYGQAVQGTLVRGVLPDEENQVSDIGNKMQIGSLAALQAGEFNIVLGVDLARVLGLAIGDKVVLVAPQGQPTPMGMVPRIKQFRLAGLFETGNYEFDLGLSFIHLDDARKLYRMGDNVSGLRLKLTDLFDAQKVTKDLNQSLQPLGQYYVSNWTQRTNLFKAIQLEKRVMFIILTLIIAVAAFNIVSTLVMAVTDKRADIAIMRTLGASPKSIMQIFITQGALIGIAGTLLGAFFGILIALNIDVIVPFIERLFKVQFLDKDVYLISQIPAQLQQNDVIGVVLISFVLSLIATLYPSYKASKINPAEALRYE